MIRHLWRADTNGDQRVRGASGTDRHRCPDTVQEQERVSELAPAIAVSIRCVQVRWQDRVESGTQGQDEAQAQPSAYSDIVATGR